ncbi:alpha/beta hydrolase [Clostridium gelidum]|uniref:Alpha/beta hydrolase n=1 Tax=Clostridium gelidum TaxID=704125 RepID=A0ABN6IQL8_9CLOT|nr:glycoside hydrolase family 95 protein [Clostridium gelidum]BCZ44164.1 alpha/beta hydrolase [Clostridium gelidum]
MNNNEIEDSKLKIWYEQPAKEWIEALPLGNGRLGSMVFGNVSKERIQLNEDTLWAGVPIKEESCGLFLEDLDEVRKLMFKGEYIKGQDIINEKLLGPWNESYAPMGNLYLDFENADSYEEYKRELDLEQGVVRVKYKINKVEFRRTVFISAPDNAIIINITASEKGKLTFNASLDSLLRFNTDSLNEDSIILKGKAPIHALPSYEEEENPIVYDDKKGIDFEILVNVKICGGSFNSENGVLKIQEADSVVIKVIAHTSFNGFKCEAGTKGKDVEKRCNETLENIDEKSFENLYSSHLKEYTELFNRVNLKLGSDENYKIPTNIRLERVVNGDEDLSLISLYFQYGRYLLIASSRFGSQPANLQGIWNEDLRPAWSSNYTTNINVEMNYWPAEICNLSECHEPLFRMIKEVSETGEKTAKQRYGCRGWTANHNIDLWRQAAPAGGSVEWAYWPMAGAWLCSHLWEHYEFTQDKSFLEEAYPTMKGAAVFLLDWLVTDKNGYLVTCPSTSPENNFLTDEGEKCSPSIASTMDMAISRELFTNCIKAIDVLKNDIEFSKELEVAKGKLYPYKIGKHGQLQEWFEDFEEFEVGHRHLSHLFGVYPGSDIGEEKTMELFEACKVSLERRLSNGGGHTGWSCSWVINLFARLKDSESAYKYLLILFRELTFSNLFNVCSPFQIDGNFGGTAAIAEMLLQSHEGYINFLPALPKEWEKGDIKGLKARGGFEVDMKWEKGRLTEAKIKSNIDNVCRIKFSRKVKVKSGELQVEAKDITENILEFTTISGREYKVI